MTFAGIMRTDLLDSFSAGLTPAGILTIFTAFCCGFFIAALLFLLAKRKPGLLPYILTVQCENKVAEISVTQYVKNSVEKQTVKSKTVQPGFIELTMEIFLKDDNTKFISELTGISGVIRAVLKSQ